MTSARHALLLALALPACAGESAGGGGTDPCGEGTPFVCRVASFTPGASAGFGEEAFVEGPPQGAGTMKGSVDVLSLGVGGEIIVVMGSPIVDRPGPDLIVFENAFYVAGDPEKPFKELGAVAVSADGGDFVEFVCDPDAYETTYCAGWHPVLSSPENGISPTDPATAGGDLFDLADLGLVEARYVRVRDLTQAIGADNAGFDLDAMAVVPE